MYNTLLTFYMIMLTDTGNPTTTIIVLYVHGKVMSVDCWGDSLTVEFMLVIIAQYCCV